MQAPKPVVETVFRKLGGRKILRERITSEADLARLVHHRIPLRALIYVKRQALTVAESDRVVRLMRLQALAENVFGDAEKAVVS
jgi:uncharacterized protein (DUF2384 family)